VRLENPRYVGIMARRSIIPKKLKIYELTCLLFTTTRARYSRVKKNTEIYSTALKYGMYGASRGTVSSMSENTEIRVRSARRSLVIAKSLLLGWYNARCMILFIYTV